MTLRPCHTSTTNLDLAAYLMLRGARLEGIEPLGAKRDCFVFTHKGILDFVNDYEAHKPIKFSPKALMEMRLELKRHARPAKVVPSVSFP